MAQSLGNFLTQFKGGNRPNKFQISHAFPTGGSPQDLLYHVRAASMPASTMTTINIPYRGRIFKLPGIRTYQTWQLTVLDDTNKLYEAYHGWSNLIKNHTTNTTSAQDDSFVDLMEEVTVQQLDYNGNPLRSIKLKYAWPNNIGPLTLDMENNDTILTFTVDMEYQWWEG